jgi:acetyl-CoA carboxylase carboxyltransferase component
MALTSRKADKIIEEFKQRENLFEKGGSDEAIEKQHRAGKLTARERLKLLIDPNTFVELDLLVTSSCTDFGLDKIKTPGDSCITGLGGINGKTVCIYAQDFTVAGGSIGAEHGAKIVKIMDFALEKGMPFIMLNDSGGIRPQEQHLAYNTYTRIFFKHPVLSGVVPQISLVMGPVAGGPCYSPALTDFIFMVEGTSYMFIGGPTVTKAMTGEDVSSEKLGGAKIHSEISGVADLVAKDDKDCIEKVRQLLSFLPSNNREKPPIVDTGDDPNRTIDDFTEIVPPDPWVPFDMKKVITRLADNGYFFELKPDYAKNLITGFARFDGYPVGVIANQPMVMGGALDIDSADKATRFIRFCDAFNVPLLWLCDSGGYLVGTRMEYGGIIRHGAKFLYATAEATVGKICLVLRKSYAGANGAMGAKTMGTDFVFAWPTAQFAVFGTDPGMAIILRSKAMQEKLAKAKDTQKLKEALAEEYNEKYQDLYKVGPGRYFDAIIEPRESRSVLVKAIKSLSNKNEQRPWKKHGNMPV